MRPFDRAPGGVPDPACSICGEAHAAWQSCNPAGALAYAALSLQFAQILAETAIDVAREHDGARNSGSQ